MHHWKSEKMTTIENETIAASVAMETPAPETTSFGNAIEDVHTALWYMGGEFEGDLPELLVNAKEGDFGINRITPEIIGQFLMEALPPDADSNARLSTGQKMFWMKVASYMGPDWIAELRRIAAFMDKVDQF